LDVLDRALEHVELVAEVVERRSCDHELRVGQPQVSGTLPSLEVTLATRLLAEDPRAPGADRNGEGPSAPLARTTPAEFRHVRIFLPDGALGNDPPADRVPGLASLGGLTNPCGRVPAPPPTAVGRRRCNRPGTSQATGPLG
jgi:hypothetical protein